MNTRTATVLVVGGMIAAGCSVAPPVANSIQPTSQNQLSGPRQAALEERSRQLLDQALRMSPRPAGTKAYVTDAIAIHDGDEFASFQSAAKVIRTDAGLTIIDAESGQTFHFSKAATVTVVPGAGRVYVVPGASLPAWARASHARAAEQAVQE